MNNFFDTSEYERSHGKPRGRGGWAFREYDDRNERDVFWANGTYTDAKRAARKHFGPRVVVVVMP